MVNTAILNSSQMANANVLLTKKECNDSDLKKQVDRAQVENHSAIKRFLTGDSSTLVLNFVEKRVTRKRSGELKINSAFDISKF